MMLRPKTHANAKIVLALYIVGNVASRGDFASPRVAAFMQYFVARSQPFIAGNSL